MLIVGKNLDALMHQHNIVDDLTRFDNTSIALRLDRSILVPNQHEIKNLKEPVTYGHAIPEGLLTLERIDDDGYTLLPQAAILACTYEFVKMPMGYFGFIQTKGSLARLLVSITCTDGQVESGYQGRVTLEIVNHAPYSVCLPPLASIAQLFIFKTSTRLAGPYDGRYQHADGPTFQLPLDGKKTDL